MQITPAARRIQERFGELQLADGSTIAPSLETCQEMVDAVLNVSMKGDDLEERIAEALKATFTMFNNDDEAWLKVARQVRLRLGLAQEMPSGATWTPIYMMEVRG